ncbi:Sodium/calcium exchanger NCL [Linum perenne]
MTQLPPKIPTMPPSWPDFSSAAAPPPPSSAAAAHNNNNNHPSWVDEFLDFSSARRGTHRRSASDSITFLESPLMTLDAGDDRRGGGGRSHNNNNNHHHQQHDFDKFDDEQFMSMFSVDDMASNPGGGGGAASSNSDHDSINDEVKEPTTATHQNKIKAADEVDSQCQSEDNNSGHQTPSNGDNGGDRIFDPKRVKRILANRQSAQRSRVRKLQYISELERSVTSLQAEVSVLSPRVAYLDHQRLLLNVDNSAIKQRIAALAQDKIFKDAQTRFISTPKDEPILVSDGGVDSVHRQQSSFIKMVSSYGGGCHETYGFLPCTETVPGNVFLIVVYGYMMFLAAKLLSCGSEILLHMLGPGIVGGLFLPVLGSLPDAAIILASGVSGSKEAAQRQISVGMGMMAGSNVMMLTVLWGSCLVIGKLDIGISTDIWTCYGARVMLISLLPFVIIQLPQAFQTQEGNTNTAVLVSLIVAIVLLISYSLYQVFQPWIQKRKIAYSKHKQLISGVLKQLKAKTLGRLFMDNGQPNVDAIQKLFSVMDEDTDGYLTAKELRALVIGIQLEEGGMDIDNAVYHVLKEFDTSDDSLIDKEEFVQGVSRWLEKAKNSALYGHRSLTNKLLLDFEEYTKKERDILGGNNEDTMSRRSIGWDAAKAGLMLLSGTFMAAVIAEPLVDAVNNFSSASSIPPFFVSFIILPFASSSEIVSVLIFASKKNMRSASLAYSEVCITLL